MTSSVMSGLFAAAAMIFRPFPPQPPPSVLIEEKEPDPLVLRVEPGPRLDNEQTQLPDPRHSLGLTRPATPPGQSRRVTARDGNNEGSAREV
jgi:hypothetical protein